MLTEKQIQEIKERMLRAMPTPYDDGKKLDIWRMKQAITDIPTLLADREEMQELIQNMRRQLEGASLRSVRRSQNHLGMVGGKGN